MQLNYKRGVLGFVRPTLRAVHHFGNPYHVILFRFELSSMALLCWYHGTCHVQCNLTHLTLLKNVRWCGKEHPQYWTEHFLNPNLFIVRKCKHVTVSLCSVVVVTKRLFIDISHYFFFVWNHLLFLYVTIRTFWCATTLCLWVDYMIICRQ